MDHNPAGRSGKSLDPSTERRGAPNETERGVASDDLRYSLRISVWVRWFAAIAWLIQHNYRPDFDSSVFVPNILLVLSLLVFNGYVHYRIRANRALTWHWALVLSAMDVCAVTTGLWISGGFNNGFFVLYYPTLATFAVVFASFRLSFAWVTMVAVLYTILSFVVASSVDLDASMEKVLFIRIVTMYAIVAAVNLIMRLERTRRREAVERERELQQERVELSQTIHDTIAQSAYMIGLGLETAIELADSDNENDRDELLAKLSATHNLSKSTMWELRHPIDVGPIFEGRELNRVLRTHASTFTTITSIRTDLDQSGPEPDLPTVTKRLLFSIAHNAMTNAYRHSNADRVGISVVFQADQLQMSVSDDGVGLPTGYEDRGHGFARMIADAARMGGRLETSAGAEGRGTVVFCTIPLDAI